MEKILVMGVSPGVGKSTFANELGQKLNIHVCHLDSLYWNPGWIETPIDDFRKSQQEFIENNEQWIIEGNYTSTIDVRENHADTIIYLELPMIICLFRVIKRRWKYRGKTRPDMGKDCPEKLDFEFVRFILTTYHRRKKNMRARLRDFQNMNPRNKTYMLKGKKKIKSFLDHI